MVSSQKYLDENREILNEKRRARYSSEERKLDYQKNRIQILEKKKNDREPCPMCGLMYRRAYITTHIKTRHEKSENIHK
jgi:hypothetical protein